MFFLHMHFLLIIILNQNLSDNRNIEIASIDYIIFSYEEELLDTGGTIASFSDWLNEDDFLIVHNGDIYSNIDIKKLLKIALKKKAPTLALIPNGPVGNVKFFPKTEKIANINSFTIKKEEIENFKENELSQYKIAQISFINDNKKISYYQTFEEIGDYLRLRFHYDSNIDKLQIVLIKPSSSVQD